MRLIYYKIYIIENKFKKILYFKCMIIIPAKLLRVRCHGWVSEVVRQYQILDLRVFCTLKAEELGSRRRGGVPGSGVFIVYMLGAFYGSCFGKTSSQEYKIHGTRIQIQVCIHAKGHGHDSTGPLSKYFKKVPLIQKIKIKLKYPA